MRMSDFASNTLALVEAVQVARRDSKWSVKVPFQYLLLSSQMDESFAELGDIVVLS